MPNRYVLGSQSPRRKELLSALVGEGCVDVVPPLDSDEPDFEGLHDWDTIARQLREIARAKFADVSLQVVYRRDRPIIVTADTIIVATDTAGQCVVLGKPPAKNWQPVVRRWFYEYLIGGTHYAATAVCVGRFDEPPLADVVKTDITFRTNVDQLVDWYIDTKEPCGKAGGYAIQGAGSIFVDRINGSLSNVVGLPLEATRELIQQLKSTADHNAPDD
jgi:septum formation protein